MTAAAPCVEERERGGVGDLKAAPGRLWACVWEEEEEEEEEEVNKI